MSWEVHGPCFVSGKYWIIDGNDVIADYISTLGDAQRIAAAPDLLDALIVARNYMSEWMRPGMAKYDQINAAIAKAKGAVA